MLPGAGVAAAPPAVAAFPRTGGTFSALDVFRLAGGGWLSAAGRRCRFLLFRQRFGLSPTPPGSAEPVPWEAAFPERRSARCPGGTAAPLGRAAAACAPCPAAGPGAVPAGAVRAVLRRGELGEPRRSFMSRCPLSPLSPSSPPVLAASVVPARGPDGGALPFPLSLALSAIVPRTSHNVKKTHTTPLLLLRVLERGFLCVCVKLFFLLSPFLPWR